MNRFFCPPSNIQNEIIEILDPDEARHITKSLRQGVGDELVVFDGSGKEYLGQIKSVDSKSGVLISIKEIIQNPVRVPDITLACAIPKKAKFDFIVEKVTELGVNRIIPILTERTIVRLEDFKKASKQKRWQTIAINAAKQCKSPFIPEVSSIMEFKEIVSILKNFDLKLLPNLEQKRTHIKEFVKESLNKKIIILIGPEGDFSPREIDIAKKAGCLGISLGNLTLKVDTAAIISVGILNILA